MFFHVGIHVSVRQGSAAGRVENGADDERRVSRVADVRGVDQSGTRTRDADSPAKRGDRGGDHAVADRDAARLARVECAELAGSVVEFACFLALLGTTTQFYATCWRYLPERDDDVIFPDADLDVPGDRTDRVQRVLPQAASITICVAGFASLLVSFLHHRTPCWNSELPAYDDVLENAD